MINKAFSRIINDNNKGRIKREEDKDKGKNKNNEEDELETDLNKIKKIILKKELKTMKKLKIKLNLLIFLK